MMIDLVPYTGVCVVVCDIHWQATLSLSSEHACNSLQCTITTVNCTNLWYNYDCIETTPPVAEVCGPNSDCFTRTCDPMTGIVIV